MDRTELGSWLRLSLTPGIGNASARRLLSAFALPEAIFGQSTQALEQVVSAAQAGALRSAPAQLPAQLDMSWDWLQASNNDALRHRILALGDAQYPAALLRIDDPPLLLYLLGNGTFPAPGVANASLPDSIAVVGSRNPTAQGADNARHFAKALVQAGLTVVSGLALGIDAAAHEGALQGAAPDSPFLATVAVLGTGVDRVYPKQHLDLARRIATNGLLLSEYPLGTPALMTNFPRRNRLIAGLAQGTLVVEAALKSGSLITARLAAEQGREVFAIPGSIHSPQSRGCHALIRQGAKLVESVADILEELRLVDGSQDAIDSIAHDAFQQSASGSFPHESGLLDALGFDPVGLDALQARSGLSTPELQAQLMSLELDGTLKRLPGGLFQRLSRTQV